MVYKNLIIAQYNANGIFSKTVEVMAFTHLKSNHKFRIKNYTVYRKDSMERGGTSSQK